MKTAVEWLGKELESYGDPQFCAIEWEQLDLLIQQAKEMEKEQIKNAWLNSLTKGDFNSADEYYNKTFKQEIEKL